MVMTEEQVRIKFKEQITGDRIYLSYEDILNEEGIRIGSKSVSITIDKFIELFGDKDLTQLSLSTSNNYKTGGWKKHINKWKAEGLID